MRRLCLVTTAMLLGMGAANAATVCDLDGEVAVACTSSGGDPVAAIFQDPANNFDAGHTEYSIHTNAAGEVTHNTGDVLNFNLPAQQGGFGVTAHFVTDDAVNASNGNAQIGVGTDTFNTMDVYFTANNATNTQLFFQDFSFDTLFARLNDLDDIVVSAFLGAAEIVSYTADALGGGEIGWFALAYDNQFFDSIRITSLGGGITVGGFQKSDHFEVSGLTGVGPGGQCAPGTCPPAVPLPAGIWLFGTALAGMGALRLRRRRTV